MSAPPPPALTPDEARAALKALAWVLTRRPDGLLEPGGEAMLSAQRKLSAYVAAHDADGVSRPA